MTEQQKEARKKSAESGHIKWIYDNCMRDRSKNDDYVFISYKSDDFEIALDKILYNTCRKYGLRVYFDTDFKENSGLWIEQFYENMCSPHCKAIIAFISNKYYTSYATLMEIMASRTENAGRNQGELFFVPINLEPLTEHNGAFNTGLGTERFADSKVNTHAREELNLFNTLFEEMQDKVPAIKRNYKIPKETVALYKEQAGTELSVGKQFLDSWNCYSLMKKVMPSANDNDNSDNDYEDAIYKKLMNAGLGSVFGKVTDEPEKSNGSDVIYPNPLGDPKDGPADPSDTAGDPSGSPRPADSISGRISITDFVNSWSGGKDPKGKSKFGSSSYKSVRLAAEGEYAKYSTGSFTSCRRLAVDFANRRIDEKGMEFISTVNGYVRSSNPPFLPSEEAKRKSVNYSPVDSSKGSGYSMNVNFSDYDCICKVLMNYLNALGLPADKFYLEFVAGSEQELVDIPAHKPEEETGDTTSDDSNDKTKKPKEAADEISGKISISDFADGWSGNKNPKCKKKFEHSSYKTVRLVGEDKYAEYSTGSFNSCRHMVADFAKKRIDEKGMDFINKVNNGDRTSNPPFLQSAEAKKKSVRYGSVDSVKVSGYSMNMNYSDYDFICKVLQSYLNALDIPADKFYLEFEGNDR